MFSYVVGTENDIVETDIYNWEKQITFVNNKHTCGLRDFTE
jgi:hypothetical protein